MASYLRSIATTASQRQLRVGEEIRHALAEVLGRGEVLHPLLQSTTVTITQVMPSPDLKQADVFLVPLGGGQVQDIIKAAAEEAPLLRRELARRVNLRFVPKLRFRPDTSFDTASHIDALLRRPEIARDLQGKPD